MSILQEIRRLRMQAQLGSDAVNLLVCLLEEREQRGGDPAFPLRDRALLGLLEMSPHRFRNARAELGHPLRGGERPRGEPLRAPRARDAAVGAALPGDAPAGGPRPRGARGAP